MIVVVGEVVLRPGTFDALKPHMEAMMAASRAENGCLFYSYARDVLEPDTIRVTERWESWSALDEHLAADHLRVWRQALAEHEVLDRRVTAYETSNPRQF